MDQNHLEIVQQPFRWGDCYLEIASQFWEGTDISGSFQNLEEKRSDARLKTDITKKGKVLRINRRMNKKRPYKTWKKNCQVTFADSSFVYLPGNQQDLQNWRAVLVNKKVIYNGSTILFKTENQFLWNLFRGLEKNRIKTFNSSAIKKFTSKVKN